MLKQKKITEEAAGTRNPGKRSPDGVRGIHEVMGSDKRKGGQPRRKDIAAESSQRHKHKEPGTGLEILSGRAEEEEFGWSRRRQCESLD